ncbi:hypothetical protein ABMC89_01260 [Sulfitobacter sp. HNIBRBA3233]|uniref:hypothetical protein n=1 Tax=Sulfitobacter marinivivus TaxID=3158558 RepID=UPI0032DF8C9A
MKLRYDLGLKLHFLIDTERSDETRQLMSDLGARCVSNSAGNLYLIGVNGYLPDAGVLISGSVVDQKRLLQGPFVVSDIPNGAGDWIAVRYSENGLRVQPDAFSCSPVFYGKGLVSNSLLLIERVLKQRGSFRVNRSAMASYFLFEASYSVQASTLATLIDGIEMLQAGAVIDVANGISVTEKKLDTSPVCADEYWSLIEKGAEEVVSNIEAAVDSFPVAVSALTGGRDSRVIYGALIAAGLVDRVRFTTLDIGRDLEVATSLLGRFGGRFEKDTPNFDEGNGVIGLVGFEAAVNAQISHLYYSNHAIQKSVAPVRYGKGYPFVLLGGGMGECYRTVYANIQKQVDALGDDENLDDFAKLNRYITGRAAASKACTDTILSEQRNTFRALSSDGARQALISHHVNFRNKYHFGNKLQPGDKKDFMPMQSETLLDLSRRVPDAILDGGHILSDLVHYYSPELAQHEYDKPWRPDRPAHPFRTDGDVSGEEIKADAGAYSATPVPAPKPQRMKPSFNKPKNGFDFIRNQSVAILDTLDDDARLGMPSAYFTGKIDWLYKAKDRRLYQWYSKLRMLDAFRP